MTGRDLKTLRETLEIDPFGFAAILGVHVSSVYRWEGSRGQISFDHGVARILEPLCERLAARPAAAAKLGETVRSQLLARGELAAVAVVIAFILETS